MSPRLSDTLPSAVKRLLVAVVAGVTMVIASATGAIAHGDPSSHYLENDVLYPAVADRPTPETEMRLIGLLFAARDGGYPIKVALVANEQDLTEDVTMLTRPQDYADFVAGELSRSGALHGPVLVVTPTGFGLAGTVPAGERGLLPLTADEAAGLVAGLPPVDGGGGEALAAAAESAARQLAAGAGYPVPTYVPPAQPLQPSAPAAAPDTSGGWNLWWSIAVFGGVFFAAVVVYEVQRRFTPTDQPPVDQPPVLSPVS